MNALPQHCTVLACLMIFIHHHCLLTVSLSLYKLASVSAVKKAICEKLHSGPVPPSSIHFSTNFIFNIKESLSPFKVSCVFLSMAAELSFSFFLSKWMTNSLSDTWNRRPIWNIQGPKWSLNENVDEYIYYMDFLTQSDWDCRKLPLTVYSIAGRLKQK